jgi:hypothetical protein
MFSIDPDYPSFSWQIPSSSHPAFSDAQQNLLRFVGP